MTPKNRAPSHPGEILRKEFLAPLQMTQSKLAQKMKVPYNLVNTLVNGKRAVTIKTAVLLSRVLGTTPEFWLRLQANYDLWQFEEAEKKNKK